MAVDLGAWASHFAQQRADKKAEKDRQWQKTLAYIEKDKAYDQALAAAKATVVDKKLESLDYSSSDSQYDNVRSENDKWLDIVNSSPYTPRREKVLNDAIWENRNSLIEGKEQSQDKYEMLTGGIDRIWDGLQTLKSKGDDFYDFTQIESVLNDYKKTGESILAFNSKWTHEEQYKKNLQEIEQWITTGKYLQDKDVDKKTPGMQLGEEYEGESFYQMIFDEAMTAWKLGRGDLSESIIDKGMEQLLRAESERKKDAINKDKLTKQNLIDNVIPQLTNESIMNIEEQVDINIANRESASPGVAAVHPDTPLSATDSTIAALASLPEVNPDIVTALDESKGVNMETDYETREDAAQNAINVIQIATGKGVGSTGEQTYDPALWKTIENIGQISIAEGALKSKKVQKEKITAVGKNIKKIFDYLEGPSLLQGIGREGAFGTDEEFDRKWSSDFEDTPDLDIYNIIKGKITIGSSEWYQSMDRILDIYMPKDGVSGDRSVNADVKWVIDEFGGNTNEKEEAGFDLLIDHLEAYDALRELQKISQQDPLNPGNYNF